MEQFFFKKRTSSVFQPNTSPQLSYLYMTDSENGQWYRAAHSHKNIVEISIIMAGDVCYIVNGKNLHAKKGDFVVMNAGMTHEEKSDNPDIKMCCIGIKNLSLNGRPKNRLIGNETSPLFSGSSYNETVNFMIETIYSTIRHEKRLCMHETIDNLMTALICMIVDAEQKEKEKNESKKKYSDGRKNEEQVLPEDIKEYLDKNFKENISLDELAQYFFVGKYHMCHSFKEKYGCSIIDYVIGRRIGEAQTMLVETDHKISFIASEMGFSSSGYFSTQFLKRVGKTPFEYRALKNMKK